MSAERTPAHAAGDLRVRGARALRGPNLWRLGPVVACEVETGALAGLTSADAEGFGERLLAALPGLAERPLGEGGERFGAALARGLPWAEVVGEVALELQSVVGVPVRFGRVGPSERGEDTAVLVVEYDEEELGIESVYEAAALVRRCLRGEEAETERVVRELRELYLRVHPRPTAWAMIQAARRRGIPVRRHPGDPVVQLGLGRGLRRLDATMTDLTSTIATDLTSDKDRTKQVLRRYGVPVPEGEVARSEEEAVEVAEELGFPVLLKPLDANDGRGTSGRLDSVDAVRAAWPDAVAEHPCVVVERFAEGRDHRVLVVDGRVVAVTERVPAHVVGDGRRSVRELAEEANRDPRRDPLSPRATLRPLPLDGVTERFLARAGRTPDTVPAVGERVQLRATANISTGGTAVDRTDRIHPRNAAVCELAAGVVGLDVAGLDVLTPDISVPFDENGAVVVEVNASPGIRMHTDPDEGTPRDVPGAILDMLYPPGTDPGIPVIAVTGTNGKTTTTRLIAHLFRRTGLCVGYTTTDGVYYQEQLLMEGDLTGPFAAGVVLAHPKVEVAVLETARGGILRSGLGYEACDVGVVLNVSPDHLGLRGIHTVEQLAEVKALIAAVVKPGGSAVLNADDPRVYAMRERTPGRVVLFSMLGERGNPRVAEHLAAGGTAVLVEEEAGRESFVVRRGGERVPVLPVDEAPLTVRGAARFQVANVLAAIGAAHARGMAPEEIAEGVRTFFPSAASTPGRMNVLRTERGTVVVDYAHNPAAVTALLDFVRRMGARRSIGVVAMPGDRRDDDLRELGRAASGFDYVVVKEHELYRRGREPGEAARLIAEGLGQGGVGPERREVVLSEPEAVDRALGLMEEGDVVVVLADDAAAVLARLRPLLVE